jgi:hypothetical protein
MANVRVDGRARVRCTVGQHVPLSKKQVCAEGFILGREGFGLRVKRC